MTQDEIKYKLHNLSDLKDLLKLINIVQRDKWKRAYPFSLSQLAYYTFPGLDANKFNTFSIPKRNGGKRLISAPHNNSFKRLLRCVMLLMNALYTPSKNANGFIEGRSIVTNSIEHIGNKYQLNIDLKDYFSNIHRSAIIQVLKSEDYKLKPQIAFFIASLCCVRLKRKHGDAFVLPQGSPASPIITNIVSKKLDEELNQLAIKKGMVYTRYADDITFSSATYEFTNRCWVLNQIKHIIRKNRFKINYKKIRFSKPGSKLEVTGVIVGQEGINVPRKYVSSIRNLLYILERYGYEIAEKKYCQTKKISIQECPDLYNIISGKLNYLKMIKGESDPVYANLLNKFQVMYKQIHIRTWDECVAAWNNMIRNESLSNDPATNELRIRIGVSLGKTIGVELTVREYKRFIEEGRRLTDICFWCQSGSKIHEIIRNKINWGPDTDGIDDYASKKVPRKGYYKIIKKTDCTDYAVLTCYYNYKTPSEFLAEEVEINYKPLTNRVSVGPKGKIRIGDIICIKEDPKLIKGTDFNSYRIIWDIMPNNNAFIFDPNCK